MILTCPACSTRYQADETKFPSAGRSVRCAKCGHVWHQDAPASALDPGIVMDEPAPPPAPMQRAEAPPASPQTSFARSYTPAFNEPPPRVRFSMPWGYIGVAIGWIGLVGLVLVIGWTATKYRQEIVTSWPQSASIYSKLGIKTGALGLQVEGVKYHEASEDGQPVLVVTGTLKNPGAAELPVPRMRAELTDADWRELYHWTFSPDVLTLKPGQSTRFVTRLSSPPSATRHLEVRPAKAGE